MRSKLAIVASLCALAWSFAAFADGIVCEGQGDSEPFRVEIANFGHFKTAFAIQQKKLDLPVYRDAVYGGLDCASYDPSKLQAECSSAEAKVGFALADGTVAIQIRELGTGSDAIRSVKFPASQCRATNEATQTFALTETAGTGAPASSGDQITAHYTLWLADAAGTRIESSHDGANPAPFTFKFNAPKLEVIPGFNAGFLDTRKDEVRWLYVPSALAYRERGAPPVIPPNATLVFKVEIQKIERPAD